MYVVFLSPVYWHGELLQLVLHTMLRKDEDWLEVAQDKALAMEMWPTRK